MQAMCSPPLPVPELSKVIKRNENGEKGKKKGDFIEENCQIKF